MGAYASTVTLDHPTAMRLASNNFKLLSGQCNITNYNQTGAEITGITKFFGADAPRVISDGFSTNGYMIRWNRTDKCFHAYYPTKAITPAGTAAAQTFTGTAPASDLNYATPAFSGTGLTAAGQVMTTTDNQTMTLNQCAGMWLLAATGATPPMLIVSNTAVTGAPAVLTVQGAAATDAGAYKILKALTPVGTNSTSALSGTPVAAQAGTEVANDVDVGIVNFLAFGV